MSEKNLSIFEWINNHNDDARVKIEDWAWLKSRYKYKRNEFYKKELSKYFDNESLSSLFNDEYDFDSFDIYLKNLFKYVYRNSLIFYYKDKEGSETELEQAFSSDAGYKQPNDDAKYAVFSLNFKEKKNEGTIFACFKRKEHHATIFELIGFISSGERSKTDVDGYSKKWEFALTWILRMTETGQAEYDKIEKMISLGTSRDSYSFDDHFLKKDDEKDRLNRLPEIIRSSYFKECEKCQDIIHRKFRANVLKELMKLKMVKELEKRSDLALFVPYWEFSTVNSFKISLLFPVYILESYAQAAFVFNLYEESNIYTLTNPRTILSLEQAYSNAKTFNPKFKSTWLNVETVKKSIEAGCKSV